VNAGHLRVPLDAGVELDVWTMGEPTAPPIVFLHGFPESHRTWRHQMAALSKRYFCIAPDQRGYAASSKPPAVQDYAIPKLVSDVFALADWFGIDTFTLAAHDWGGAVGWAAALTQPKRVSKLVICNAPHPYVFQHSLVHDFAQREASQYIRAFRDQDIEGEVRRNGLDWFFNQHFGRLLGAQITAEDRQAYLEEWNQPGALTAMLNWYRASPMQVPAMDDPAGSTAFLDRPFPILVMPALIVWGMADKSLLPCQLDGLDGLVRDLTIVRIEEAGHFVTWEAHQEVTASIADWLDMAGSSRAPHTKSS
jgi:pimeloyl-ACP methyl ester carboxylesterase